MVGPVGFVVAQSAGPPGGTMSRYASAIAVGLAVAALSPALAAQLDVRFVTADGTWDCKDETGVRTGTIVLADTAHAFIKTDGKLGGYGKFAQIDGDFHFPKFVVTTGYLKDELKVIGLSIRGPANDPENLDSEVFLHAVVGFDAKHYWDCVRRGGRANAPPA
jgi:hypothetical protein